MLGSDAVAFLRDTALGTRVVVRYRLDDGPAGATDTTREARATGAPSATDGAGAASATGGAGAANATDALGELVSRDAVHCVIATKRGPEQVSLAAVIAAKPVPPAPAPRRRRRPSPLP